MYNKKCFNKNQKASQFVFGLIPVTIELKQYLASCNFVQTKRTIADLWPIKYPLTAATSLASSVHLLHLLRTYSFVGLKARLFLVKKLF